MPRTTPLLLVATMLVLGVLIEAVGFGAAAWPSKLPMAALLLLALVRTRTAPSRD